MAIKKEDNSLRNAKQRAAGVRRASLNNKLTGKKTKAAAQPKAKPKITPVPLPEPKIGLTSKGNKGIYKRINSKGNKGIYK